MKTKFYTKEVLGKVDTELNKMLIEAGDVIVKEIKARTPVITGTLSDSIERSEPSNGDISVGTDVYYAKFVEFGTRYFGPRFFMTNGFLAAMPAIKRIFSRKVL